MVRPSTRAVNSEGNLYIASGRPGEKTDPSRPKPCVALAAHRRAIAALGRCVFRVRARSRNHQRDRPPRDGLAGSERRGKVALACPAFSRREIGEKYRPLSGRQITTTLVYVHKAAAIWWPEEGRQNVPARRARLRFVALPWCMFGAVSPRSAFYMSTAGVKWGPGWAVPRRIAHRRRHRRTHWHLALAVPSPPTSRPRWHQRLPLAPHLVAARRQPGVAIEMANPRSRRYWTAVAAVWGKPLPIR